MCIPFPLFLSTISPTIMAIRSPYFDRSKVIIQLDKPPLCRSGSDYFDKSHGSFFGCVEHQLGSLVEALGDTAPSRLLCRRRRSSTVPCTPCKQVLNPVVALFQDCPIFLAQWNESGDGTGNSGTTRTLHAHPANDAEPCWRKLEEHLENSVRHLCDCQCFLRAFTPYRNWFALQTSLIASPHIQPESSVLEGWRCRLVAQSRPPRVTFEKSNGMTLETARRVLDLHERDGQDGTIPMKRRKRLAHTDTNNVSDTFSHRYPHRPLRESVRSPLGLLEELVAHSPWRLLLSTIMLNRTSRVQVDHIFYEFLQKWPSPDALLNVPVNDVAKLIQPLGMNHRRASGIQAFCRDFLALAESKDTTKLTETDIKGMYHCGDYAYDAYRIFIQRDLTVEPSDRALKAYIEYKWGLVRER